MANNFFGVMCDIGGEIVGRPRLVTPVSYERHSRQYVAECMVEAAETGADEDVAAARNALTAEDRLRNLPRGEANPMWRLLHAQEIGAIAVEA